MNETSGSATEIEQLVNQSWILPPTLQAIEDEVKKQNPDYTTLERLESENLDFVERHFGPELNSKYREICRRQTESPTSETYKEIFDFCYQTGFCDFIPAPTVMRGRQTLASILGYLSGEKEPLTVVDFGSGDGRIALGISICAPAVEMVFAIDKSPMAHERMKVNLSNLKDGEKEKASGKITQVTADYCDIADLMEVLPQTKNGFNLVIAAFTPDLLEVLPYAKSALAPGGKIIAYYPISRGEERGWCDNLNRNSWHNWLDWRVIDVRKYFPRQEIAGFEGKAPI